MMKMSFGDLFLGKMIMGNCCYCDNTGVMFREYKCFHNPSANNVCNDEGGNVCIPEECLKMKCEYCK